MKCVSCGANLSPGVDVCRHCNTLNDTDFRLLGQARVGSAASVSEETACPRCHKPLIFLNIQMGETYPVHRCKGCLGTFFPSSDLNRLANNVAQGKGMDRERLAQLCSETPREIWPITYIPCPSCQQMMLREMFGETSGVVCDRCNEHGVWLDGGELGRLLSWARARGFESPSESSPGEGKSLSHNEQLITRFYQAFQNKDHRSMAACYHPQVVFGDPAFPRLEGWRASAMWMMLCERGKDLELQFRNVRASEIEGEAFWEAWYTFGKSGPVVHNQIYAVFNFRDGLIVEHRDRFDMKKWMAAALGFKGKLLGLLPPGRRLVQKQALRGLEDFIVARKLKASDFPNG